MSMSDPHEFREDVNDYSMCVCGIAAAAHDAVMLNRTSKAPSGPVETTEAEARFLGLCPYCYSPMNGPCGRCISEANAAGTTYEFGDLLTAEVDERDAMIATDDTELQAKDATIAVRDASIARLTTRLAKDDKDATIEDLTAEVAMLRGQVQAALGEIVRLEATNALDSPNLLGASCPDSCGGQSWTGVNTNYGRRWRCDTCGRIISRYVSDPMQAADDRRAL